MQAFDHDDVGLSLLQVRSDLRPARKRRAADAETGSVRHLSQSPLTAAKVATLKVAQPADPVSNGFNGQVNGTYA